MTSHPKPRSPRIQFEEAEDGQVGAKRASAPEALEIRCPHCGESLGVISSEALAEPEGG